MFSTDDGFAVGDVIGDGYDEIVIGFKALVGLTYVYSGSGTALSAFLSGINENDAMAIGNVTMAPKEEILVAGDQSHKIDVFNGSGAFLSSMDESGYNLGDGFAVGDVLAGDGHDEAVVAGDESGIIDITDVDWQLLSFEQFRDRAINKDLIYLYAHLTREK